MTDVEKAAEAAKIELEAQKKFEDLKKSLEGKSASELIELVLDARSEAKERRLKERELSERLVKIDSDKVSEEQKKMADEGKFKELLAAKEKEIETLNQTLKPKADEYDKFRQEEIEVIKKVLGDKWDDEYSNLSLPALRKMAVTLSSKKDDPNLDKGSSGAGSNGKALNAAQKKEAYEKFPQWTKEKAEEAWLDVLISTGKIK